MTTSAITTIDHDRQLTVGAAADQFARAGIFAAYQKRKAANTLRRQKNDLDSFVEWLVYTHFYADAAGHADRLYNDPAAWENINFGLVDGFVLWLLDRGYALGTVNLRLSTVKQYVKLAFQANALASDQHSLIRTVTGFQFKEHKHVNEKRSAEGKATRKGAKKAQAVALTAAQVKALKTQPDTPQGRRDALLMCLLLDHGLRVGEVALLDVTTINLQTKELKFYRPKVSKDQTHRLTNDTLRAARAWFASGDAPPVGKLLRGRPARAKGQTVTIGDLGKNGMSERAITARVADLGAQIGVMGLSAHDLRHSWATDASRNGTKLEDLKVAGGWNSLVMPDRYIEEAKIANEGVKLGRD